MPARVFSPTDWHEVRDDTLVSPFLNPADSKSGLDHRAAGGLPFSVAAGRLGANATSLIHVHPFVAQVTSSWKAGFWCAFASRTACAWSSSHSSSVTPSSRCKARSSNS